MKAENDSRKGGEHTEDPLRVGHPGYSPYTLRRAVWALEPALLEAVQV